MRYDKKKNPVGDYFERHPQDIRVTLFILTLASCICFATDHLPLNPRIKIRTIQNIKSNISQVRKDGKVTSNVAKTEDQQLENRGKHAVISPKKEKLENISRGAEGLRIDPNQVDHDILKKLAVPDRVADNWIKYIGAGGQINSRRDLARIYGMKEVLLSDLEEHIIWPPPEEKKEYFLQIEINTATIYDWQKLRGIGPVLSKRIVKFRSLLGGFHSVDQVGETYGVNDSLFRAIRPHLHQSQQPEQLHINTLSADQLAAHPYISYKEAEILTLFREQNGPFRQPMDLLRTEIVDSLWLKRLSPYLDIQ